VSSLDLSGDISVPVSYAANQSRDIVLEIFDSSWNWLGAEKQTVPAGSSTITVTTNIGAIVGGNYHIKIGLRPVDGDWTQSLLDRYQNNVPAASNDNDNVSFNAVPAQIDLSGDITLNVNYETSADRTVVVEIFDINWNWLGWNIQNVNAGSGTSTHNLSIGPLAAGEYRLKISLRDTANDDTTSVFDEYTTTSATDDNTISYSDDLVSVSPLSAFNLGQASVVTVDYTASQDLEILVVVANGDDGWSWQAFERYGVSAGEGSVSIDVNMWESAAVGSNYKLQVLLVPVGGVIEDTLDEISTLGTNTK